MMTFCSSRRPIVLTPIATSTVLYEKVVAFTSRVGVNGTR
jgi:hypothetical protein